MNKPLILVVEDDPSVRNLITITLKTNDYRYLAAPSGSAAIMEATSHNPEIILLDLGLPDMDGVQVIQTVRSWSNVPIIVISARSEDNDKIKALDAGAASVDLEEKDVYRKPGITQDDEALNGEMAELNHLTAARITYAIGENSYAIDRATLQSWLVQGEDGTYTISQDEAAAFVRHMAYETDTFGLAHTFKTSGKPDVSAFY